MVCGLFVFAFILYLLSILVDFLHVCLFVNVLLLFVCLLIDDVGHLVNLKDKTLIHATN